MLELQKIYHIFFMKEYCQYFAQRYKTMSNNYDKAVYYIEDTNYSRALPFIQNALCISPGFPLALKHYYSCLREVESHEVSNKHPVLAQIREKYVNKLLEKANLEQTGCQNAGQLYEEALRWSRKMKSRQILSDYLQLYLEEGKIDQIAGILKKHEDKWKVPLSTMTSNFLNLYQHILFQIGQFSDHFQAIAQQILTRKRIDNKKYFYQNAIKVGLKLKKFETAFQLLQRFKASTYLIRYYQTLFQSQSAKLLKSTLTQTTKLCLAKASPRLIDHCGCLLFKLSDKHPELIGSSYLTFRLGRVRASKGQFAWIGQRTGNQSKKQGEVVSEIKEKLIKFLMENLAKQIHFRDEKTLEYVKSIIDKLDQGFYQNEYSRQLLLKSIMNVISKAEEQLQK